MNTTGSILLSGINFSFMSMPLISKRLGWVLLLCSLYSLPVALTQAKGVYQTPEAYLDDVFSGTVPKSQTVWLTGKTGQTAQQILQHKPASLRLRYWRKKQRSAWVLDEIGKDKPITVGITIDRNRIEHIRILIFRESRGFEVRYPFFTDQFKQVGLDKQLRLDRSIDGITGATLSVRALTRLSRMALYLHNKVISEHDAP